MVKIVDLTEDSDEDISVKSKTEPSKKPPQYLAREVLAPRTNNAISKANSRSDSSPAFIEAINTATIDQLKKLLKRVCTQNKASRLIVEEEFLVPEKDVVLYHADTASEEANSSWPSSSSTEDSDASDEDEEDEDDERNENGKMADPDLQNEYYTQVVADRRKSHVEAEGTKEAKQASRDMSEENRLDDAMSRLAMDLGFCQKMPAGIVTAVCENCKTTFDPASNASLERSSCVWHAGERTIPDEDADIWADHDHDAHGSYESYANDPHYLSGFLWSCCEENFKAAGCLTTRHYTQTGSIVDVLRQPLSGEEALDAAKKKDQSLKRKASEEVGEVYKRPRYATCEHCKEEFDVTDNTRGDCEWHEGEKEFDSDSNVWNDMDEKWQVHDSLINDPYYEDGFVWTCCDKEGSAEGCRKTKHFAAGLPRKKPHY